MSFEPAHYDGAAFSLRRTGCWHPIARAPRRSNTDDRVILASNMSHLCSFLPARWGQQLETIRDDDTVFPNKKKSGVLDQRKEGNEQIARKRSEHILCNDSDVGTAVILMSKQALEVAAFTYSHIFYAHEKADNSGETTMMAPDTTRYLGRRH